MTEESKIRYSRQIAIPSIGKEGQQKLRESAVLVIGCGALGSMAAMELAGAGIGKIGLVDYDTIDVSNLQRQFFFRTDECGQLKIDILREKLLALNPEIEVSICKGFMTPANLLEIFKDYDFIIDATDNPESKKMIEESCKNLGLPYTLGGVSALKGQVMTVVDGSAGFFDFFPELLSDDYLPCSIGGVLGPVAALCASIQSAEAIKYITGAGELLTNKILFFDLETNTFHLYKI